MTIKKSRESGVELLRIIAILGVIMIHFSDRALPVLSELGGGGRLLLLLFFRSLSSSAVDIFLIISGYFMCCNNRRTLGKSLNLIFQVCIFSELIYLLECVLSLYPLSIKHIVGSFVPDNYYATLFVVLYFISPYINIVLSKLTEEGLKRFVCVLFTIFSVASVFSLIFEEVTNKSYMGINTIGAWGSEQGFNIVNFSLCYIVGASLRRITLPSILVKPRFLCFMIALTTSVIFLWSVINQLWFLTDGMRSAWVYDNPLVIILGCLMFLLFKNIHFSSRSINSVAKCVFATFIIHNCYIKYFPIEEICNLQWCMLYIYYIVFSLASIFIAWVAMKIYDIVTYRLWQKLDNRIIVNLDTDVQ